LRHSRASNLSFTKTSYGGRFLLWQKKNCYLTTLKNHPANRQEESMHDAVKGADEWVWEEVKDSDGDIGRASSGYSNASEDGELA